MNVVEKLISGADLTKTEYMELLRMENDIEIKKCLAQEALRLKKRYYGEKIFIRGLIEFTNYCKNDCYYCGIRRQNKNICRYRLCKEEILSCCEQGYALGFRTFVLQGGEDVYFTDDKIEEIIQNIKRKYPDCAVTLSIGEKSYDTYRRYKEAGADRYLLRHETANESHYQMLHPDTMKLKKRMQCLYDLKKLGFQTGAGFMVGSPGQTDEYLAEDLMFLKTLQPEMVGIGPFIPHHDTVFAKESAGSVERTLYLLSVIRILLPKVLLPATTALGTLDEKGREKGFAAGANVVMPNLSPINYRKNYDLYDNKVSFGMEAAEHLEELKRKIEDCGYQIAYEKGDVAEE